MLFWTFALAGLKFPILANLFKFLFFNLIFMVVPVSYSYLLDASLNSSLWDNNSPLSLISILPVVESTEGALLSLSTSIFVLLIVYLFSTMVWSLTNILLVTSLSSLIWG